MKQLSIYEISLLIKVMKFQTESECLNYFNKDYEGLFDSGEVINVYKQYQQ